MSASLSLPIRHPGGGAAADLIEVNAFAGGGVFGFFAPSVMEKPGLGEAGGVGFDIDGFAEDAQEAGAKGLDLLGAKLVAGYVRIEAGLIENFVGDPIAHPGEYGLIEEDGFDWGFAEGEDAGEIRKGESIFDRIGSEGGDGGDGPGIFQQSNFADAAHISVKQSAAVVQGQFQFDMAWGGIVRLKLPQGPGHAEVNVEVFPGLQAKPQVFTGAAGAEHGSIDELLYQLGRIIAVEDFQVRLDHGHHDFFAGRGPIRQAPPGFHFREFRHGETADFLSF